MGTMTAWPPSGSDDAPTSTTFDQLHPRVQRWIWEQDWRHLRDAQEAAIPFVLDRRRDVLIAAATASGKTEAAFLPICSNLLVDPPASGFAAVYISPLKALINDQYARMDRLCDALDIPVHPWHGDVPASRKRQALDHPAGLLLITPESLEALFVVHGPRTRTLFAASRYIVVDELHSFIGTPRGAQLRSLLHRLEHSGRHRVCRIGLSATLSDMSSAAEFLRPHGGSKVVLVTSQEDPQELRLQVRGYRTTTPDSEDAADRGQQAVADDLFTVLRGSDNLVFVDGRAGVESYADLLTRRSASQRVPNEFLPHHGSLSKELREQVEVRLKDRTTPTTAICTSTLEMGIDIGSVTSVTQIGAPSSVAAIRQRLGRSGRRGEPAVLRIHVSEPELTEHTPPQDQLRAALVQTVACVQLLLERWYEPPDTGGLHLSTLAQQVMSLVAEHGGVSPADAFRVLCSEGPFPSITAQLFRQLLRDLNAHDLLRQESDGLLLHGDRGEQLVNHYSFFTAFVTADEYQLVADGRRLGALPIAHPLVSGGCLIFAGRRWKIAAVDERAKVVELTASSGGRPARFSGSGAAVHDRIRTKMRHIYESDASPVYLDSSAADLLAEARRTYRRLGLRDMPLLDAGRDTLLFPFRGDDVMATLAVALQTRGVNVALDGVALTLTDTSFDWAVDQLTDLAAAQPPEPEELAAHVTNKTFDKYDEYLGDEALTAAYAARRFDIPASWHTLDRLRAALDRTTSRVRRSVSAPPRLADPPHRHRIGDLPYAVVDVETTGLNPRRHRIVEVAVVRMAPEGTIIDEWSTLVHPRDDPGASTSVHGLTTADLAGAPSFAQVAGELAARISDAVVVAHNVTFDAAFLTSEFTRIGAPPDDLLTLCTLLLAGRLGASKTSLQLADCAAAEGVTTTAAHTAADDAHVAARLLSIYLRRAKNTGLRWLDELGATGRLPTPNWAPDTLETHPTKQRDRQQRVELHDLAAILPVPAFDDARKTLYADLVARNAADGMLATAEAVDLEELANSLDLNQAVRNEVHRTLRDNWILWPEARDVLSRLDVI